MKCLFKSEERKIVPLETDLKAGTVKGVTNNGGESGTTSLRIHWVA